MATISAIRKNSDERAELRRVIELAKAAKIKLAKLQTALEKADEYKESAAAGLAAATAAVAKAKNDHTALTAQAIANGELPPAATSITDARIAEAEARDSMTAATAAHAHLEQQYADLETECACADNCVATAVNALLAQPMAELLKQTKRAHAELITCRAALQALYADLGAPNFADSVRAYNAKQERDAPLVEIRTAARDLVMVGGCIDRQAETRAAAAGERWKAARIALTTDADAKLPEL